MWFITDVIVEVDIIYLELCLFASLNKFTSDPGGKYGLIQLSLIWEYYGNRVKNGYNLGLSNWIILSVGNMPGFLGKTFKKFLRSGMQVFSFYQSFSIGLI